MSIGSSLPQEDAPVNERVGIGERIRAMERLEIRREDGRGNWDSWRIGRALWRGVEFLGEEGNSGHIGLVGVLRAGEQTIARTVK